MNRKEFIQKTAIGLTTISVGVSCAEQKRKKISKIGPQTVAAELGDIRSVLLHLGRNMWCDYPTEMMGAPAPESAESMNRKPKYKIVCTVDIWRRIVDHAAKAGINMIVIDLGEGLYYPSHPELSVEGTWSVETMREEIKYMNERGIEAVPKLNFSTAHNGWMGDYTHMISSKPYYRMCEEVIRDVVEIFGNPRFFHIGMDEERIDFLQRQKAQYVCSRMGEFWWQDFYHIVREVEKYGARPWMWSDYCWNTEDFYEKCPKSVIQQNWYYDQQNGGFDIETNPTTDARILKAFIKLDEAGFDQVPCGTNWIGWKRRELGLKADDVMGKLVKFGRENISKERLKGFMMATWLTSVNDEECVQEILKGINQLGEAMK